MNPALRDEPELTRTWRRVWELDVNGVLTGDTLVAPAAGEVEMPIVARADGVAYVLSAIVANRQELLQRGGRDRGETRRWDGESLVDEDLGVGRMIDDEQRDQIEE